MALTLANNAQLAQPRMAGNLVVDDMISLAGRQYPIEKALRVYDKLIKTNKTGNETYHQSPNIIGYVNNISGDLPVTDVSFVRKDPTTGKWNHTEPETQTSVPTRELIDMKRNFDAHVQQNPGIYINTPISDHRAKAYRKQGFVDVDLDGIDKTQVMDKRRFQNSPVVQDLYSVMDRVALPDSDNIVSALERSRGITSPLQPTQQDISHLKQSANKALQSNIESRARNELLSQGYDDYQVNDILQELNLANTNTQRIATVEHGEDFLPF